MEDKDLQKKLEEMRMISFNEDERLYLQMMQDNISRMASNSSNCKNWMVMIVAALLAVSFDISSMNWWLLLIALPIFLFWWLDAYYLKLERGMRNRQRLFLNICTGVEETEQYSSALFYFKPLYKDEILSEDQEKEGYTTTKGCFWSESVLPFYSITLVVLIAVVVVLNCFMAS